MVQVGVILVECDGHDADKDKRVVEILRTKGRSGQVWRMKVPKEIKGRKRPSDFGDLSIATSSAAAQNHPNNWARHVRSPLGNVSASSAV